MTRCVLVYGMPIPAFTGLVPEYGSLVSFPGLAFPLRRTVCLDGAPRRRAYAARLCRAEEGVRPSVSVDLRKFFPYFTLHYTLSQSPRR